MGEYKAEIIAVGTELLLGQIANTNAQWLSQKLANQGISVYFHGVVGDNLERVKTAFQLASDRSDLIIVTGGLGPTDDDMTREAFQAITNNHLKEDEQTIDKIRGYFAKTKRKMTPNNRKQALVFENSLVLQNSTGMAPGMIVDFNGKKWVFLPGVPREMKTITTEHVIPYLKRTFLLTSVIESRMLRFIGIGESQLEHELKPLIDVQQNPTIAPLASEGEVAIRLTAKAESKEKANELIDKTELSVLEQVGNYFYGYDSTSIHECVFELLKSKKLTLAAAESLTGGGFSNEIVSLSGVSQVYMGSVVCYSVYSKQHLLGISPELIEVHGTISEQCAEAMAKNVCSKLNSSIGISFTGVAGPDDSEGKSAGTVFISVHGHGHKGEMNTEAFHFQGDRDTIRTRAIKKGFELLYRLLKDL
ncbi:competence/damage-inducible protein A [Aquibacillus rhizosphaerae]|uniref:Putative competence-damage inducible protein n=1 Tax=Aquibacillus rhizosphaerae TaxID=3051431 RepID=A0ABT7KZS2_9BACI|nr:competence/damage-inducible protein A [Aquibacillus sp. LR5S19]MDL4838996.1 competence/damage-inducible protein A [Aquibacillus sp. LR5S19]